MWKLGLNASTRTQLERIIARPDNARQLKRAEALLWVDNGESVTSVVNRLSVTRQSFYNWRDNLQGRTGPIRQRLEDEPKSGVPRTKSATQCGHPVG